MQNAYTIVVLILLYSTCSFTYHFHFITWYQQDIGQNLFEVLPHAALLPMVKLYH